MEYAEPYGLRYEDMEPALDFQTNHFRRDNSHQMDNIRLFQQNPHHFQHALANLAVDVKPRLTKEQHDLLETEYSKQNKPNTQTKKSFAEALGVSLDKVNNWFQNRRAKSKQDAKKQAGGFDHMSSGQQRQYSMNNADHSNYNHVEYLNALNDSGVNLNVMSHGLGINQQESMSSRHHGSIGMGSLPGSTFQLPSRHKSVVDCMPAEDTSRRTLTQDQFNAFSGSNFMSNPADAAQLTTPGDDKNGYNFWPDMIEWGDAADIVGSEPMQHALSTDSYASAAEPPPLNTFSSSDSVESQVKTPSGASEWPDNAPSVNIMSATQQPDYSSSGHNVSPTNTAQLKNNQWQPGQSVPVDYMAMAREFKEAAMRNISQPISRPEMRSQSVPYVEQPLAFPADEAYLRRDSTVQLSSDIRNFGLDEQSQHLIKARQMSGSIASRRQRPRPAALALRSTSFCGQIPASASSAMPSSNAGVANGGQTLRRIKSSNTMNGIASGRIQKNIGGVQRSPMNLAFADGGPTPRFERRVSSYSPVRPGMGVGNTSLAPPTPLSPVELSGMSDLQRAWPPWQGQMPEAITRQQSVAERDIDPVTQALTSSTTSPSNMSSPPATPLYPTTNFSRNRLGSIAVVDNTPPQSAPASQQNFSRPFLNTASSQSDMASAGMTMLRSRSQQQYVESDFPLPLMQNIAYAPQQQIPVSNAGGQYMDMSMQYGGAMAVVDANGNIQLQYPNMPYMQSAMQQQLTPPHGMPFLPSSPVVHMGNKAMAQAELFVHEYSPPQDSKPSVTPRKVTEPGPRSYTFANQGPEHYEKSRKSDVTSSPTSSVASSSTAN